MVASFPVYLEIAGSKLMFTWLSLSVGIPGGLSEECQLQTELALVPQGATNLAPL